VIECDSSLNGKSSILFSDLKASELHQVFVARSVVKGNRGNGIEVVNGKNCKVYLEGNEVKRNEKAGVMINHSSGKKATDNKAKVWIRGGEA
jgi:hypothetical protein